MSRIFPGALPPASLEEVEAEIRGAIEFHLEGMREDGVPIPTPQSKVDYVEVAGVPLHGDGAVDGGRRS